MYLNFVMIFRYFVSFVNCTFSPLRDFSAIIPDIFIKPCILLQITFKPFLCLEQFLVCSETGDIQLCNFAHVNIISILYLLNCIHPHGTESLLCLIAFQSM